MIGPDFPLQIAEILRAPIRARAKAEIAYRDLCRYSYDTLYERVCRLGSVLASLGVRPGETVAVMDWDSHRYLEAFFAIPMLGAVLFTVNVRLSAEKLSYTLKDAQVRVLICNTDFVPMLAAVSGAVQDIVLILSSESSECELEALLARADPGHIFPDLDENTPATLFYTTGTTGEPKGVSFTHRQIVLHTLAEAVALKLSPDDVYMPMTPMFHVHAWGVPYAATLCGIKQVYPGRYDPEMLLALVSREGVTLSHCVPTVLRMLLDSPTAGDVDLRGLRVIVGGSAMPEALCRAGLARGMDVFAGYGMSESCPILTVAQVKPDLRDRPEQALEFRVKAGLPMPLVDVRIADDEVVVRAPWLARGYRGDEAASAALWEGGYLHTGDMGAIDEHGYLTIIDRIKDVIKSGGEWVSSLEIENIVAGLPAVAEVAVIGTADPVWGERPAVFVVLHPAATLSADDVRGHVAAQAAAGKISRFAVPSYVRIVSALPKTSVGKPDKKAMRRQFTPIP